MKTPKPKRQPSVEKLETHVTAAEQVEIKEVVEKPNLVGTYNISLETPEVVYKRVEVAANDVIGLGDVLQIVSADLPYDSHTNRK